MLSTKENASMSTRSAFNTVKMKSGSTFRIPTSWKVITHNNYVCLTAPEDDLSLRFLELPLVQHLESMATEAWKRIYPDFSLTVSQNISQPITDNWEKMSQIIYEVPASESRMVLAIVRGFQNKGYVCLVEGKMAGISRRVSELMLMTESWKPVGFKEQPLNTHKTKEWTEEDKHIFDTFVSEAMRKLDIPGASIAIIRQDGKSVYKKGFGIKQIGSDDRVTVDTPFMIGSITKPLTTLMMAMLVDQRKLSWETPVTDILPTFKLDDSFLTQNLRLRHTVSASTGMPQGGMESIFQHKSSEERLLEMREMKPTTRLGETFQYSNYLVMAGGYAAAHVHMPDKTLEEAYATAMQTLVFEPLQMKSTVLRFEDAVKLGSAFPHGIDFNANLCQVSLNIEKFAYSLAPAGAVWSTIGDMSQYLLLEMNKGVLGNKRIVSEEAILERRKPGIRIGENASYGLCLMLSKAQGLHMVGHGGGTFGFSSDLFFLPEKEVGMVILTNTYLAHTGFLAAVKQKFLELTFDVTPCSEDIISTACQQREQTLKKNHELISLEQNDTVWIEQLLGDFSSTRLGPAKLSRASSGLGYEIQFKEWKTRVGSEVEKNGRRNLVLIDPPSYGGIKLLIEGDGDILVLDVGQERHEFVRLSLCNKNSCNQKAKMV